MKYEVRVLNHKTNEVEYKTVTAEELKALYWSIWFDIFDVVAVTEWPPRRSKKFSKKC